MKEVKLLSSLYTLGYIKFKVLCSIHSLEDKLFAYCELNCHGCLKIYTILLANITMKESTLVHRVYICSIIFYRENMFNKFPLVAKQYD